MTALRFILAPSVMASENTDQDKVPTASQSDPALAPKPKRRRIKRDGPPEYQFVTVTDIAQFKDEPVKRTVRSQAMINHKHLMAEAKRKGKQASSTDAAVSEATIPQAPSVVQEPLPDASPADLTPPSPRRHEQGASASLQIWGATSQGQDLPSSNDPPTTSQRASRKVIDYEETDSHEEVVIRMLVGKLARFHHIGDGIDPFVVLPQFQHPQLNALHLTRTSMRAFASDSTVEKWLPAMLSHPHILLSSTILASTWLDMRAECSGDSWRTALVKAETLCMINERLRNPNTELEDATLMIILHLLAGEMWSCNEKVLRVHESAVARFIFQRGGMRSLENRAVVEIAAACCYHCDIFCEAQTLPLFAAWAPADFLLPDEGTALPESPLFSPRGDYHTVANDAHCSAHTLNLLRDMRDLTDVFIAHNAGLGSVYDVEAEGPGRLSPPAVEYEAKASVIHQRLSSLPSAYTPGHAASDDWVYETCRIAALIYTTAIIMRVPFSVAANFSHHHHEPPDAGSSAKPSAGDDPTTRLTEALYGSLGRTDIANLWNNMTGVLYWVCAVGAAAARMPSTIDMTAQTRLQNEAYSVWVRRCLIMTSTRTMIVLIFQHPVPMLIAQKRLLKVQELIGTGDVRGPE